MWPVLVAGAVGWLAANRNSSKTKCVQKTLLGPRTGRTYDVEEFPDAGFLVVRASGGDASAYGVFQHVQPKNPGDARFSWRGGKGAGELLHGMCLDLGIVREEARGSGLGARGPESGSGQEPRAKSQQPSAPNNVVQHPAAKTA